MVRYEWSKGTGNKKYRVQIFEKGKKIKTVQFGDKRYQHYEDKTPLKLYSHLNHKDKQRRKNFKKRHGAQGFYKNKYSPAWFSWKYLW